MDMNQVFPSNPVSIFVFGIIIGAGAIILWNKFNGIVMCIIIIILFLIYKILEKKDFKLKQRKE